MKIEDLNHARLFLTVTFTASVLMTGCGGEKQDTTPPASERSKITSTEPDSEAEPTTESDPGSPINLLPEPSAPNAEPNSFAEVTAKLDQGGSMFGYLATDSFLNSVNDELEKLRVLFNEQAETASEKEGVNSAFKIVTALIENSGVRQLTGVGFSSVAVEDGLHRTKLVLHHREGEGTGYLWKLFGSEPQPLAGLDLLPTTTAAAGFSEFDLGAVWRAVTAEIAASGSPEVKQAVEQAPAMMQAMTQMTIEELFTAMGTEFGFVITLDESQMLPLPLPTPEPIQIPTPNLLIVFKPGNDTFYSRLEALLSANPMVKKASEGNLRTLEMGALLPMVPSLRPTIIFDGEYLILGTNPDVIKQALSVKSGQAEGFKDTDEFRRLARVLPNYGNGFTYMSKRFNDLVNQTRTIGSAENKLVGELIGGLSESADTLQISQVTAEGLMWTGASTVEPASAMLTTVTTGGGAIFAGMTIPALAKARAKAAEIKCRNQCLAIQAAKSKWAQQNRKPPNTVVTLANLIDAELINKETACPADGKLLIGEIKVHANCFQHKHSEFPQKEEAK